MHWPLYYPDTPPIHPIPPPPMGPPVSSIDNWSYYFSQFLKWEVDQKSEDEMRMH
jgi:hypothetical protein